MGVWNSFSYICTRARHFVESFAHCRAASIVIPFYPRPPLHHPSSLTLVYFVPDFHHQQSSGHMGLIHSFHMPIAQTISILSDPLYSLTLFLFQLSSTSSFLTLSICDTPTKLLKHLISRTFTFLLSAILIPHVSAPYNAVGTITPSYRHFLAFIPNPLLLSTLFSAHHVL